MPTRDISYTDIGFNPTSPLIGPGDTSAAVDGLHLAPLMHGQLTVIAPDATRAPTVVPTPDPAVALHRSAPQGVPVQRRIVPNVVLTMPAPVVVHGRPVVPAHLAVSQSSASVVQGVLHTRAIPDPDPVFNGSDFDPPMPDSPGPVTRWSARTLPNPATQPRGFYKLGALSPDDNTDGLPADANAWAPAPGSEIVVNLNSRYPFKPSVASHTHLSLSGKTVTIPTCVKFNSSYVEHLYADMGAMLTKPFTLLIFAVLHPPARGARNHILDAGGDAGSVIPAATRKAWLHSGVSGNTSISEHYGYRTALVGVGDHLLGFNDQNPTTRISRTPLEGKLAPRMLFFCVNGSKSYAGSYSKSGNHKRSVSLQDLGNQRNLVIGRANGLINRRYASSMIVFEIRYLGGAATDDQLEGHYEQMASTWHLAEYT